MLSRLIVGGVAGLAAPLTIAATIHWSRDNQVSTARDSAARARARIVAETLNKPTATTGSREPWTVTRATAADNVMVLDIETDRIDLARTIADQVVEPARARGYQEILIYLRRPGGGDGPVERRVRWTPGEGVVIH